MITLKNSDDLAKMRFAAKVAADALTSIAPFVVPGITTKQLDEKMEAFIRAQGCEPAFKGYKNFPGTCCMSVNNQVVHCIPSDLALEEGDILTIDTGAKYQDFFSDTAKTFIVGTTSPIVKAFVDDTYSALIAGIQQARVGNHISDISRAVATVATIGKYGIVQQFVGHGIGKAIHEDPQIPNFIPTHQGALLVPGMVICIEPILTLTSPSEIVNSGEWNTFTKNGEVAAHFEHTVYIGPDGPEVLTKRPDENLK